MVSSISGVTNKNDDGIYTWEKTVKDVNNVDENFYNARDMGFLRLNYSRITTLGSLSKFDNADIFKINVQSAGKLSISLRSGDTEEEKPVLDLSKYEAKIKELEALTGTGTTTSLDDQVAQLEKEAEKSLVEINAPGMRVQVYMKQGGREVMVGDSHASSGSKMRENMDKILTGEYRAKSGEYYVKVTRDDTVNSNKEVPYAMQMQLGKTYIHDYILKEQASDDTKNGSETKYSTTGFNARLTTSNILALQASTNQATASMLSDGYLNFANITYSKNSKY